MAMEIERRFLLKNDHWRTEVDTGTAIVQGYLLAERGKTIRIRIAGESAWLTIKTFVSDRSRREFEYSIPLNDARAMMQLCSRKIQKVRYRLPITEDLCFEIDEFQGENAPLVLAEIELTSENQLFTIPPWLGEEITADGRYSNAALSKRPFAQWRKG